MMDYLHRPSRIFRPPRQDYFDLSQRDRTRLFLFFDGPGRREAAGGHSLPKSPKTIDQPAENDCTNERPDKYDEPSAPSQGASNDAEQQSTSYSREL